MKDLFRDIINFIVLPFELYFLKKVLKKRKRAGSLLQEIRELDEVVFVLSPHSDDEALGVGGMIKGMHHSTDFFIFKIGRAHV